MVEATTRREFIRMGAGGGLALWGFLSDPLDLFPYHTTPKKLEGQKEAPAEAIIHPNLTKRIAKLYIESYPETQLAKDLKNEKLLEVFIKGSIDEDSPLTRTFEHSYNPQRSAEHDSWELFGGLGNKGNKDC